MADQAIFGQSKILNHPEKIQAWRQGDLDTLVTVEIDLTNRCNNRCPGCAGGRTAAAAELTIAEVRQTLDSLRYDLGAKAVIFTGGGEPLLHPRVLDAIRWAKNRGFDVGLITNGLVLADKPEWNEPLLTLCTWIRVSLDAGSPGQYRETHGVGRYYSVVMAVDALMATKRRLGSSCTVGLGYLTGSTTVGEMRPFLETATGLGVDYAQFRPFHGDLTDIRPEFDRLKAEFPIATASTQKYAHFGDADKRPYTECHGRFFTSVIGADANVYVCCHMRGNPRYVLGNLRTESLIDIWDRRHSLTIDFVDCPLFCRADECNRLLFELQKPKTHVNFL